MPRSAIWLRIALFALFATAAFAQNPAQQEVASADKTAAITRQFGSNFTLAADITPMTGDLDGDGNEDLVAVATGKNPLLKEGEFGYKVIDPYNAFFGYGNPKITMGFGSMEPGPAKYVLVIHNWRAEKPRAKFVIVNLPFHKLSLGSVVLKKKPLMAIEAEESGGINSIVFWDGRKYRWEVMGQSEPE